MEKEPLKEANKLIKAQQDTIDYQQETISKIKGSIDNQLKQMDILLDIIIDLKLKEEYLLFDVEATQREKQVLTKLLKEKE